MPVSLIENMHLITSLSEMKVIYYILRHTWGYQEYDTPKTITLDEFEHGRKRIPRSALTGRARIVLPSMLARLRAWLEANPASGIT